MTGWLAPRCTTGWKWRAVVRAVACYWAVATPVAAVGADPDFFETKIRPLFAEHCYVCHSSTAGKSKGGLKLDSKESFLSGGDSGALTVPGDPAASLLIRAVRRSDENISAMPPEHPLSTQRIELLEKWIRDGAHYPASNRPKEDPHGHWAFQPITRPTTPSIHQSAWPNSAVDQFLLAKMESAGVRPADDAERSVVGRRLSFALTGLPPSLADLERLRSPSTTAVEDYVDRLLASPHFGERWARHWMDLIRYADSGGHEYDYEFEGAWRYRDYLVRAFNRDLPFDQLVREHVAGDLLAPRVEAERNESLLGTGWWPLQEHASAPVDLANDEAERLDNQIDVLGKTFNALTVGCARCHDHKFDPIKTKEYYGLFGIAAASPVVRTWSNGPAFDHHAAKLQKLRDGLDEKRAGGQRALAPKLSIEGGKLFADFAEKMPAGWTLHGHGEIVAENNAKLRGLPPGFWSGTLSAKLPAYLCSPQFILEDDQIDFLVAGVDSTVQVVVANYQIIRDPIYNGLKLPVAGTEMKWLRFQVGRWKGKRVHLEIFTGKVDPHHRVLHTKDTAVNQFGVRAVLLSKGSQPKPVDQPAVDPKADDAFRRLASTLEAAIPAPERFLGVQDLDGFDAPVLHRGDASKPKATGEPRRYLSLTGVPMAARQRGSGRRELAEVLASPRNPLTARVFVNRVWHHLFGRGLVATVDNFGRLGDKPSHPELLDFLADRFIHVHQWSVKRLIRELVLTRAFQIQGGPAPTVDPLNRLLSRFPLRRLDAEAVRDALLAVSGRLERRLGGETIPVPHNLAASGSDSGDNYPPSGPVDGLSRRSLYLASRRNFPSTFLEIFDKPAPLGTFGGRDVSQVPTQALAMLNDPLATGQAKAWSERIERIKEPPADRVALMFREAIARTPTAAERRLLQELLDGDPQQWQDVAASLFNMKEFLYVP